MSDDDTDLYDDLKETTVPPQAKKMKPSASIVSLENRIKTLESQRSETTKENEILKRNMGSLYRTAKAEIRRKDAEIDSLQQQLEQRHVAR